LSDAVVKAMAALRPEPLALNERRPSLPASPSRASRMKIPKPAAVGAMLGALLDELRSAETHELYDETLIEDILTLGKDLALPPTAAAIVEAAAAATSSLARGTRTPGLPAGLPATGFSPYIPAPASAAAPVAASASAWTIPAVERHPWPGTTGPSQVPSQGPRQGPSPGRSAIKMTPAASCATQAGALWEIGDMYSSDWASHIPILIPSDEGQAAWARLCQRLAVDPSQASSSRRPSDLSSDSGVTGRPGLPPMSVMQAFEKALYQGNPEASPLPSESTPGGAMPIGAAATAPLADRGPMMYQIGTQHLAASPMSEPIGDDRFFQIGTRMGPEPSCVSHSSLSPPSPRGPMMVNIATKHSPRSRLRMSMTPAGTPPDAKQVGTAAWQSLRSSLGTTGALNALLYEITWADAQELMQS